MKDGTGWGQGRHRADPSLRMKRWMVESKDSKIERISACWPRGADAMKREMEVCKAQARSWIWPLACRLS